MQRLQAGLQAGSDAIIRRGSRLGRSGEAAAARAPTTPVMFKSFVPTLEIWRYEDDAAARRAPDAVLQHAGVVLRYLSEVYGYMGATAKESSAISMIIEECELM